MDLDSSLGGAPSPTWLGRLSCAFEVKMVASASAVSVYYALPLYFVFPSISLLVLGLLLIAVVDLQRNSIHVHQDTLEHHHV